jgi:hypothetical protein
MTSRRQPVARLLGAEPVSLPRTSNWPVLPSEACQVYPVSMNPEDVRRMVGGWQAVERREREERRKAGPDSAAAVQGALELMDLFGEMHGWPPAENEARRRNNELARARWVRVRSFYQAHGKAAKPEAP